MTTNNFIITIKIFLSSVFVPFTSNYAPMWNLVRYNVKLIDWKFKQWSKYQKNAVRPSVTFFDPGTHVKRAGSNLYVQKCFKIVATVTGLPFGTEEVRVLAARRSVSSAIRCLDPLTKILYRNNIIAACNPLHRNLVQLEYASFQQYGETLKTAIVKYTSGRWIVT